MKLFNGILKFKLESGNEEVTEDKYDEFFNSAKSRNFKYYNAIQKRQRDKIDKAQMRKSNFQLVIEDTAPHKLGEYVISLTLSAMNLIVTIISLSTKADKSFRM